MNDPEFRKLLDHFHLSWKGYRKVRKGVKKRLVQHMVTLDCRSLEEYLGRLDREPRARARAELLLGVSISRFFRDRGVWEVLGKKMVPLVTGSRVERVKVWSAGCASGEEAYSFRIMWDILEKRHGCCRGLEIWGRDGSDHPQRRQ